MGALERWPVIAEEVIEEKQIRKEHLEVADGMDSNVKSSRHGTSSSKMATRFKGHTAMAGRWAWAVKDGCQARR